MTATLRALTDASPTIARAVAESGTPERFDTGTNAEDWIMRRTAGLRYKTYKVRVGVERVVRLWALTCCARGAVR